jgi:hypothetical protein
MGRHPLGRSKRMISGMFKQILSNFANTLKDLMKDNVITIEHLETTNHNKLNETHSLVLGALCYSINQLIEKESIIALGHGLKPKAFRKKFTPDISLWKANGKRKLVALIDYESTNSSDSRIVKRDLRNYENYIESPQPFDIPKFWAIIVTLPSKKVRESDWYSWDDIDKRIPKTEYVKMLENPFQYWFPQYASKFDELIKERERCPLYIVNLDATKVRLCLPKEETFSIRLNA